jgi:hypothetical protein
MMTVPLRRVDRGQGVNFLWTGAESSASQGFVGDYDNSTTSALSRLGRTIVKITVSVGRAYVQYWRIARCGLLCALWMQPHSSRIFGQAVCRRRPRHSPCNRGMRLKDRRTPWRVGCCQLCATSVNCSPPRACYASSQWVYAHAYCAVGGIREMKRVSLDLNGKCRGGSGERVAYIPPTAAWTARWCVVVRQVRRSTLVAGPMRIPISRTRSGRVRGRSAA